MNKNDLTQGNIWTKLILYFLPLAAGTVLQQLYNAVDGLIVGRFIGTIALAAVGGSATLISHAMINFFVALTNGGSVLVAQYFGANNDKALQKAVHTFLLSLSVLGVTISIIGFIFTPKMLALMKTPAETMAESVAYLRIIFVGVLFQIVYNMGASILRAVGNSKSPFIYLGVSSVTNIVLDLLFVCVFNMGVAGAAYATIISQGISAVLVILNLIKAKAESYGLKFDALRVDWRILKRMLGIGLPLGCQSLIYSYTNMVAQVGVNVLGTVVVASWAVEGKLDAFFWGLMTSVNTTITNFVGQNYGKGDFERMKKGVKCAFILFMGLSFAFCGVLLLTPHLFVPLFDSNPEVIECTIHLVYFFGPTYWIWTINEVLSGALRGEGKTGVTFGIAFVSVCIFRLAWLKFVFGANPTLDCLSMCYPISWSLASIGMIIYYVIHVKHKSVVQ